MKHRLFKFSQETKYKNPKTAVDKMLFLVSSSETIKQKNTSLFLLKKGTSVTTVKLRVNTKD